MFALARSTFALVISSVPVLGQCPEWRTGFVHPAVSAPVHALTVYDDGSSVSLAVGGAFMDIDGESSFRRIALWTGERWRPLQFGLDDTVYALETFFLFGQPALIAGGAFFDAMQPADPRFFGVWNGSAWSQPSGGSPDGTVFALKAFDDGSGPAIFAGGQFTSIGGSPHVGIARWNGTSWANIGDVAGVVYALAVHDDGSGAALYAGGSFSSIGGIAANNVARWNGSTWSSVGSGTDGAVRVVATFQGALYAGGAFANAGGASALRIASWNGTSWSAAALGTDAPVRALSVHDDGDGAKLYVSGEFTHAGGFLSPAVARWDGANWSATDLGLAGAGFALEEFDDGTGTRLLCGGSCRLQTGTSQLNLARWNGQRWTAISTGLDGEAWKLENFDDGAGNALYVGGQFQNAAGIQVDSIAKWNGTTWTPIGGVHGSLQVVRALETHDDVNGHALYVAGSFSSVGAGVPAASIARWDGAVWSALGSGVNANVYEVLSADVGDGPRLYVAGSFTLAGGFPTNRVAAWDGSSWIAMPGINPSSSIAIGLCAYDDGTGPALYVGGKFTLAAGGRDIARWDGSQWVNVGGGVMAPLDSVVRELVVHDDGTGSQLYAGGFFTTIGTRTNNNLARWNGTVWSGVGAEPPNLISVLGVLDDGLGKGRRLFAILDRLDFGFASDIRRWDGAAWTIITALPYAGDFRDIEVFHPTPHGGAEMWVGGSFSTLAGVDTDGLAVWALCDEVGRRVCFGDGAGTPCPCGNDSAASEAAGCANSTGLGGALRASGWTSLANDTLVLTASGLPATSSSLFFQGTTLVNGGLGSTFGDGLRCAGGAVIRMGTNFATGGVVSFGYDVPGDPLVHVVGALAQPGVTRIYQSWYRNAASFCTPSTFNLTNAIELVWEP